MVRKESIVQITIFLTMVYCFMAVIHNSIFEERRFVYFTRFSFFLYLLALTIQLIYKFRYKIFLKYFKLKIDKELNQSFYEIFILIIVKIFLFKDITSNLSKYQTYEKNWVIWNTFVLIALIISRLNILNF
jgi:hypothetical protein